MIKFSTGLIMVALLFGHYAYGQREVTGKVTDAGDGSVLPGVNVLIKGSSTGTVTDRDGNYSLSVPEEATIVFSYLGYAVEEVVVSGRSIIDMALTSDIRQLSEVVVVAYGATSRRKFTGSLAAIGAGEIEQIPQVSALQMMQGRAAGVLVEDNSGRPGAVGSIVIRGVGTLGDETSPLFVIDGTPTTRFSDFNPNDIESISVLKDAAATSIYGSRAANGVVLITTKSGRSGETKFTLNAQVGFSDLENPNDFRMMNATEYKDYYREAYVNAGQNPDDPNSGFYLPPNADSINTDWLDEVIQTGVTQLYELTASGGTEKTRHFISASYFNQEGTVIGTEFERITGRINFGFTPAKRLDIDLKILGAFTDEALQFSDGGRGGTFSGAFNVAPTASPFATESTPSNLNGLGFNFDLPSNAGHNPLGTATIRSNDRTRVRAFPTIRLTYEPIDKLTLSSSASVDYAFRKRNAFQSKFYFAETDNGLAELETETFTETNFNVTAAYEYEINSDHVITPLIGFETFKSTFEAEESVTRDFAFDGIDNFAAGALPLRRDFDFESNTLVSFFSRVNYSFRNKLFLDVSYRRDGSSRFGPENQWGNFYAVGVGYNLLDEAFMQPTRNVLSELRLRASFGIQGNNAIGDFAFRNTFTPGGFFIVPPSGGGTGMPNSGAQPNEPGNPALKWEQSETFNVGIDFGILSNRLVGTVEYYHRSSIDLLAERLISRTSGFPTVIDNVGDVENKGIELTLNSRNLEIGGFTWTSGFNISFNENEIVGLNGQSDTLFVEDVDNTLIRIVGQPLDQWFLPQYTGVDPATGRPMYFTEDEQGRGITSDINQAAITVSGQSNLTPDFFGSFTNTFSYKGISLSAMFYFKYGFEVYRSQLRDLSVPSGNNQPAANLRRWQQPGDITSVPRADDETGQLNSTRWLEDGSFIRLRNVALSYSLPASITERLKMSNLTFSVRGVNLLTFTEFRGFNPDTGLFEDDDYPINRTVTFGISARF